MLIAFPFGVKYSFVVSFNPLPSYNVYNVCITPFPNVFVPINLTLSLFSFTAAANISEELAVFSFIRITTGMFITC